MFPLLKPRLAHGPSGPSTGLSFAILIQCFASSSETEPRLPSAWGAVVGCRITNVRSLHTSHCAQKSGNAICVQGTQQPDGFLPASNGYRCGVQQGLGVRTGQVGCSTGRRRHRVLRDVGRVVRPGLPRGGPLPELSVLRRLFPASPLFLPTNSLSGQAEPLQGLGLPHESREPRPAPLPPLPPPLIPPRMRDSSLIGAQRGEPASSL